jgi:multidrug efflux pump subunit AcrA (membrane-fusion protein)
VPSRIAKLSEPFASGGTREFRSPPEAHILILKPDSHVKALESRSQLLDSALASADEANRRWEECRALVDQLRIENAALRQALNQAQLLANANGHLPQPPPQVNLPPHLTANPPAIQPSRLTAPSAENKQKDKEKDEKKP